MLSKATAQLVEEVSAHFGERVKKKARENPEAYLISMLQVIKEQLPESWATLEMTIEQAQFDENLDEARQKLTQAP